MSRRSRGRNSTHDVLNYSNPGKESWSGHGAFRGARRRRRGSRLRRPLTRRGAAYKYWRVLGRRKMDRCGNLRALWGGLIDVLVSGPRGPEMRAIGGGLHTLQPATTHPGTRSANRRRVREPCPSSPPAPPSSGSRARLRLCPPPPTPPPAPPPSPPPTSPRRPAVEMPLACCC